MQPKRRQSGSQPSVHRCRGQATSFCLDMSPSAFRWGECGSAQRGLAWTQGFPTDSWSPNVPAAPFLLLTCVWTHKFPGHLAHCEVTPWGLLSHLWAGLNGNWASQSEKDSSRGCCLGSAGPTPMQGSWATNTLESEERVAPLADVLNHITELGFY